MKKAGTRGFIAPARNPIAYAPDRRAVWIALLTALIPTLTVNLCYVISSSQGHVPACVPYFEGCTSISSAGRHGISYSLFKLGMASSAVLLVMFWRGMSAHILSGTGRGAAVVAAVGMGGAVFLVLYAAFLGSEGHIYFLLRRFGSILYFGLTMLTQLMALWGAGWKRSRHDGLRAQ